MPREQKRRSTSDRAVYVGTFAVISVIVGGGLAASVELIPAMWLPNPFRLAPGPAVAGFLLTAGYEKLLGSNLESVVKYALGVSLTAALLSVVGTVVLFLAVLGAGGH